MSTAYLLLALLAVVKLSQQTAEKEGSELKVQKMVLAYVQKYHIAIS